MLNKKFNHSKLKPQVHKDKSYLEWLHNSLIPCFVCGSQQRLEAHHVKRDSSDKRDDDKVLMLCYNHHHGLELSPHGTPNEFRDIYPIQYQLKIAKLQYKRYLKETNNV